MLDIRDFGQCDPTGTQTSWRALQNAINAVATGAAGGDISAPAGTFLIDQQITVPNTMTSRVVPDGVITQNQTSLTSASGAFQPSDANLITPAYLIGPGIMPGTYVQSYISANSVVMSQPALFSAPSGESITITAPTTPSQRVIRIIGAGTSKIPSTLLGGTVLDMRYGLVNSFTGGATVAQPSAPTPTASSGGTVPAALYTFYTAFYGTAGETIASAPFGITTTSTGKITVTANGTPPTGYTTGINVYATQQIGAGPVTYLGRVGSTAGTSLVLSSLPAINSLAPAFTILTAPSSQFSIADIGRFVVAPGIPSGTIIAGFISPTAVSLGTSAPAITPGLTNLFVTINAPKIFTGGAGSLVFENLTFADLSGQRYYDGTIASGQLTTLTSASGKFAATDVGKTISVSGAGTPAIGSVGTLLTTIQSYTSTTQVTLAKAAAQAVSGATINWGDSAPFVLTTLTTLRLVNVSFYGTGDGAQGNAQDAIIFGGTGGTPTTMAAVYAGYGGALVENCYFNSIRRAAFLRAAANGIVIRDNAVAQTCGAADNTEAAIDLAGALAGFPIYVEGNVVADNLVEGQSYPYCIRLGWAFKNTIRGNNLFDQTAVGMGLPSVASYYIGGADAGSFTNIIICSEDNDGGGVPAIEDHAFGGNTVMTHDGSLTVARTSGTPTDSPPFRTARFDESTNKLWIYNGPGGVWKSVALS